MFLIYTRRLISVVLGLVLSSTAAFASHIVGGDMSLQHKTGSVYTLTLNLYYDAINGSPGAIDQQVVAGIFEKATNRHMANESLPLVASATVGYDSPICVRAGIGTGHLIYSSDISLPAGVYNSTAGYYAAVERCCRNQSISNVDSPGEAAQAFYLEFPAVVRNGQPFINSTPHRFPVLASYACLNSLLNHNFGVVDADGDSLVYDLVIPLNGHASVLNPLSLNPQPAPYALVNMSTGNDPANQIPSSPAMAINRRTGRLTLTPSSMGLYVFGIRCQEYRRGQKIGEARHEYQLFVLNCPPGSPPRAQVLVGPGNVPYRPGRDTLRLRPGSNHCLRIQATDPDPATRLTFSLEPLGPAVAQPVFRGPLSGFIRSPGYPDTLTTTLCFSECLDTGGQVHYLDVLVRDQPCRLPRFDTVRVAFIAEQGNNQAPVLSTSFGPRTDTLVVRVPLGQVYTGTLTGLDSDANPLVLSADGQGFALPAAGMTFTAQNGISRATATFGWQPTCETGLASRLVRFQLAESAVCNPTTREQLVRFEVITPVDAVAFRPPNVVTPNGDNKNDVFTLPDLPVDFCDARFAGIRIFSRWGQQVFESASRTFRWAGAGAAGLYFYHVTYTDGRRFKGWLEVMP